MKPVFSSKLQIKHVRNIISTQNVYTTLKKIQFPSKLNKGQGGYLETKKGF